MTLSTLTSRVSYPGTGSAGPFAIPFRFLSTADLRVTKRSAAGVQTTLTLATHYTVTGANEATGTLILVTPLAVGETLFIRRDPALTQPTSIRNQGAFFPATHEDEFDRIVMQIQALADEVDRSLKLPETISGSAGLTELEPTLGRVVVGTGTGFSMASLDAGSVAIPAEGRDTATLTEYLAKNSVFNVLDFSTSAIELGVVDATQAWQDAIDAAEAAATIRTIAIGDVGSLSYAMPKVWGPAGVYKISAQLNIDLGANIEGEDGCFLKATLDTFDIISTASENGYQVRIKGIHFIGGKRHIVLTRTNIDGSMNTIEECSHSSGDYTFPAISINTVSVNNLIKNPRVLSRPYFLDIVASDKLTIQGGWINGYAQTADGSGNHQHKPASTASIVNRATELTIRDALFVPEPSTGGAAKAETRWVDNYYHTTIENCHFGSENAGFPIVYNFASAFSNVSPFLSGTGVIIRGGIAYAGAAARADRGLVVCKTAVPAQIIIEDVTGATDSKIVNTAVMVAADLVTPRTLANWIAANTNAQNPKISIRIIGNSTWGTSGTDIVAPELSKYTEYQTQGVNGTGNTRFVERLVVGTQTEVTAGAPLQSSGLTFPAVQVANANANTLDDYEEGDWTPVITFGGAAVGMTFAAGPSGKYTKVGRLVTVSMYFGFSAKGASTGNLSIAGLPFAVVNALGAYAPAMIRAVAITFTGMMQGYAPINGSVIQLEQITEAGANTILTHANFGNTSELMLSLSYIV